MKVFNRDENMYMFRKLADFDLCHTTQRGIVAMLLAWLRRLDECFGIDLRILT